MKKLSKRLLSLMLAVIMAMPVILAMPSTASAAAGYNSGLVAHYFIDNNFTKDYWRNYDLEQVNGGTYYWRNGGVQFPGSNKSYFRVRLNGMLSNVNFDNGFSISFSARRNSSDWHRYFELSSNGGYGNGDQSESFFFATNGNAKVNHPAANNNKKNETGSPSLGDDGGWHNWVVIIKNGSFQVFRDGNDCGTQSDSGRINADWFNTVRNDGYLILGASSYKNDPNFNGWLKNFKVYDVPLSSSQINECDDDELFQYTFDNTLNERFTGSSNAAAVMQSYGGNYSNEGDHIYCKDSWLMSSVPASIRSEEHKRNWRMDFDISPVQDFGANRLELLPGITDKTGLDSNYNGGQSFGVSTNGKIYFKTTDFDNGAWGDTGLNLKTVYNTNGKERHTISYAYYEGTICVLIDFVVKFTRDVSKYRSFFENINTVTYPGRNGAGVHMDLWDFSCYSFWEFPTCGIDASSVNINERLKGRYFLGDIEANTISDNYDFNVSGSGAEWQSADGIEGAHFNGGNNGNSPNYLYMPKDRTKNMFSRANNRSGFTFSFMSKSLHTDSWQRIFELTNVGSAYGGGSGNRYAMFTSQYDGSAHSNCYSGNSELNVLGGVDSWHVWTLTYKEGVVIVFRDGTEIRREESNKFNAAWFNEILTNGQILLGASTFGDPGFDGYIRDLRIYDIALNASQVSDVYTDTYNNRTYFDGVTGDERTAAINRLQSAMTDYESKMNNISSDFLTNTKAAYDAYVVANRYYDALVYGNSQRITANSINRVVNNLNAKKNAMGNWSYKVGTAHGGFSRDDTYTSASDYAEVYNNIVWGGIVQNNCTDKSDANYEGCSARGSKVTTWSGSFGAKNEYEPVLYRPSVVMLYDGVNTPSTSVLYRSRRYRGAIGNVQISDYAVYINNNAQGLYLNNSWCGTDNNSNFQYTYHQFKNNEKKNKNGRVSHINSYTDVYNYISDYLSGEARNRFYANKLYFDGTNQFASGVYSKKITGITWGFLYGNDDNSKDKREQIVTENSDYPIYVINYKPIRDKLNTAKATAKQVANYKEGGLATFFQGCDEATGIDPQYNYDWNNVEACVNDCANKISTAIGHIDANKTADNIYPQLRAELADAHSPTGNSAKTDMDNYWELRSNYTALSVDNFFQAYFHAATEHMAGLVSNNYNSSNASTVLNNLKTYHHALKPQARFNELDSAYDTAVALSNNESEMVKYTTSSVARFKAYLNNEIADDKIPYEKTKGTSSSYTTYDGQNKTPVNARQLISSDEQSAIDTEKTNIEGASGRYLERRADFSALDSAKNYISNYITTYGADYTTSSKTALTNKINSAEEFPLENSADRANTGVSQNDAIDAETAKYQAINAASELDPLANLKYFDAEYDKANTFLMNLNGKAAEYTASSIQAVIDAVQAAAVSGEGHANKSASTIANAGAVDRADFGKAVQTDANSFAAGIKTAMDNLKTIKDVESSGIDTSAYEEAVVKINTLDPDAYTIGESILTARSNVNAVMGNKEATSTKTYTADGKTSSIQVLNSAINIEGAESQADVDALITTTLTAINSSIRTYPVTKHNAGSQAFTISSKKGTYKNGSATYGTTIVASVDDGTEAAWYLEIETASMHKELAFAGYGVRFKTNILGATTLKAVKRGSGEKRVKILRKYGDNEITDKSPVQLVEFTSGDYTLPAAPSMTGFTFYKYIYNGNEYNAGETVTGISEDVEIYACYNQKDGAEKYMVSAYDATGETVGIIDMLFKSYNDKVEFTCNGAAGWLESIDGTNYRPFAKGSKVSFFVTEKISLKAVDAETFAQYSLPAVNLRKDGVQDNDSKKVFNAQIVNDGKEIQEYGILIAAPYGSTPIDMNNLVQSMVVVENSGRHDGENGYQILRAKSTKLVGAGQFTISVKSLPENYIYRGYAIYKDSDGNLQTVYSEAMR